MTAASLADAAVVVSVCVAGLRRRVHHALHPLALLGAQDAVALGEIGGPSPLRRAVQRRGGCISGCADRLRLAIAGPAHAAEQGDGTGKPNRVIQIPSEYAVAVWPLSPLV